MNTYRYKIALTVEVEAPDIFDADDIIADSFGVGEQAGANVVEMSVLDIDG